MKHTEKQKKIVLRIVFLLYLTAVFFITLFRAAGKQKLILTPFWEWAQLFTASNKLHWIIQIGLNIVLFIPFGFLIPQLFRQLQSPLRTIGCGFLSSVLIETVQYIAERGYTETDDMIHNTLGTIIGFLLYRMLCAHKTDHREKPE